MLTLVIAPFFISFLLRTLAWKQILADEGAGRRGAQGARRSSGRAATSPAPPFAVIFGLTYNFIPFMTLPIYTSLERLDLRYVEAGGDLYASPARTFWRITLPLSLPGIVSGTLLTFIPAAGRLHQREPELPRRRRDGDDRKRRSRPTSSCCRTTRRRRRSRSS